MARNGSGTFSRLYNWVADAAAGIKILASRMDAEMDGMATALTDSIAKDGQTVPTANLPMGTFRHTGVGSATALTDYAAATQVVNGLMVSGTIAGTDTLTITTAITPSAYAARQYLFGIAENTNTGAVTLNWNSLGARSVKKRGGNALAAGDIVAGMGCVFLDDGTDYELLNPADYMNLGKHTLPYLASAMVSRTTNGAAPGSTELATNDVMLVTKDFDQTTSEGVQFYVPMPKSWNEGTVTAQFGWTAASGSGTVTWSISASAFSNDDAMDAAFGSAQTVTDTLIAANDLHITDETAAITVGGTPAESDFVIFQITRDITDTLTADAKLIWCKIFVTYSAGNDA